MYRTIFFFVIFLEILSGHSPLVQAQNGDASFIKPTKVLLVGVNHYPDSAWPSLRGTQNDVELFTQFFTEKMNVAPRDIVILSDVKGDENKDFYPTRVNIEREFVRLADSVTEHDFVFIHFGGHGAQIPESLDVPPHERYGQDAVFITRDTKDWSKGELPNAIRDHEIGRWIHNIREKGAFVWYVTDSCHSGGGTRGGGAEDESPRSISATDLKIPQDAFAAALKRSENAKDNIQKLDFIPPNVAFYAALPTQQTFSMTLPMGIDSSKNNHHGLFSYYLCKTLEQIVEEDIQIGYDDLLKTIELQYASTPIKNITPTPMAEGSDLAKAVLRNRDVERTLNIRYAAETHRLNVGLFHGIGIGSVLEVFDKVGFEQKSLGFIKVEHESLYSSVAIPVEWNGIAATKEFPNRPLRCEPVDIQAGIDPEITIAFDPPKETYDKLKKNLFADNNGPFRFTESTEVEADFLLREAEGHHFTTPHVEIIPLRSPLKMLTFGKFGGAVPMLDVEQIQANFRNIAVAHFLLRIAGRSERINKTMSQTMFDPLNAHGHNPVTTEISVYKTDQPGAVADEVLRGSEITRLNWIKKNTNEIPAETNQFLHLQNQDSLAVVAKIVRDEERLKAIQNQIDKYDIETQRNFNKNYHGYKAWFNVITIDANCQVCSRYIASGDNCISADQEVSCILQFYLAKNDSVDSDIVIVIATAEKLTLPLKTNQDDESYQSKLETEFLPFLAHNDAKTKGVRGSTTTGYFIMKVFPVITGTIHSH